MPNGTLKPVLDMQEPTGKEWDTVLDWLYRGTEDGADEGLNTYFGAWFQRTLRAYYQSHCNSKVIEASLPEIIQVFDRFARKEFEGLGETIRLARATLRDETAPPQDHANALDVIHNVERAFTRTYRWAFDKDAPMGGTKT